VQADAVGTRPPELGLPRRADRRADEAAARGRIEGRARAGHRRRDSRCPWPGVPRPDVSRGTEPAAGIRGSNARRDTRVQPWIVGPLRPGDSPRRSPVIPATASGRLENGALVRGAGRFLPIADGPGCGPSPSGAVRRPTPAPPGSTRTSPAPRRVSARRRVTSGAAAPTAGSASSRSRRSRPLRHRDVIDTIDPEPTVRRCRCNLLCGKEKRRIRVRSAIPEAAGARCRWPVPPAGRTIG
jgi:hypothetical protein